MQHVQQIYVASDDLCPRIIGEWGRESAIASVGVAIFFLFVFVPIQANQCARPTRNKESTRFTLTWWLRKQVQLHRHSPWSITIWYLWISEQVYKLVLIHHGLTRFLKFQKYQQVLVIDKSGHPIALVSMQVLLLSETRLFSLLIKVKAWVFVKDAHKQLFPTLLSRQPMLHKSENTML